MLGVSLHVKFTKYFVVPVSVMFVDIYCSFNYLRGRYILYVTIVTYYSNLQRLGKQVNEIGVNFNHRR